MTNEQTFPSAHARVNTLLPTEQSLSQIDKVISELKSEKEQTQRQIIDLVGSYIDLEKNEEQSKSLKETKEAMSLIQSLHEIIKTIQTMSAKSQQVVYEITHDIRSLDYARNNITTWIELIIKIKTFESNIQVINRLIGQKMFSDIAVLLKEVLPNATYLRTFPKIPLLSSLITSFDMELDVLKKCIADEFDASFTSKASLRAPIGPMRDATLVIDQLDQTFRSSILTWYYTLLLREYISIFRTSEELSSLDNVPRRFAWLKRFIKTFDEEHKDIWAAVPWKVLEGFCLRFANTTKDDLTETLKRSQENGSLDVKSLLTVMQQTMEVEASFGRRFGIAPSSPTEKTASNTSLEQTSGPKFAGCMSVVFEPYLGIWVDAEHKAVQPYISDISNREKSQPLHLSLTEEELQTWLFSSAVDLFWYFSQLLPRIGKVGSSRAFWDMSVMMKRSLAELGAEYESKIIRNDKKTLSSEEAKILAMFMNTSDYCSRLTTELEAKIKENISAEYKELVVFSAEQEKFHGLLGLTNQTLIKRLEVNLGPFLNAMVKVTWGTMQSVGDQSDYMTQLVSALKIILPIIKKTLVNPVHQKFFLDKFVEAIAARYLDNIYKCKPISEVGAEQLLLDVHVLKSALLQFGAANSPSDNFAAHFVKFVNKSIFKLQSLLKTVHAPSEPADGIIQSYLFFSDMQPAVQDKTGAASPVVVEEKLNMREREKKLVELRDGFAKILELKGLKKIEQNSLIDQFMNSMRRTHPEFFSSVSPQHFIDAKGSSSTPAPPPAIHAALDAITAPSSTTKSKLDSVGRVFADMGSRWSSGRNVPTKK